MNQARSSTKLGDPPRDARVAETEISRLARSVLAFMESQDSATIVAIWSAAMADAGWLDDE